MSQYLNSRTAYVAELTKQGLKEAVERGEVVSFIPIGYQLEWTNAGKTVSLDAERASLVHQAFELAAKGKSVRAIWRILRDAGLTSRNDKPICVGSVHHFLRNPFYIGQMRYLEKRYKGNYPPLISTELFDQVQASLTARRTAPESLT